MTKKQFKTGRDWPHPNFLTTNFFTNNDNKKKPKNLKF